MTTTLLMESLHIYSIVPWSSLTKKPSSFERVIHDSMKRRNFLPDIDIDMDSKLVSIMSSPMPSISME